MQHRPPAPPTGPHQPPAPGLAAEMARPTPRRTARRLLVGALLVLGFGLCALVTAVSIGLSTGLVAAIVGLLFATIPLGIVVPSLVWVDRFEHEPTRLLLLAFAYGAFVATAVAIVINSGSMAVLSGLTTRDPLSVSAVAVAPVVEESAKGLGILLVWRLARDELDGIVDGIVYGGIVAAGFAFAENILYLGRAFVEAGSEGLVATFVLRGLFGPFAHPLFTACTGIGIGIAATTGKRWVRVVAPVVGWCVGVSLHGLWNLTAVTASEGTIPVFVVLQVPIFLAFVGLVVWSRQREGRTIARNLQRYAQAGWLSAVEVQMLSSLTARQQALAWARATGGPVAKRAMERFQDDAADLALLRVRLDAGADVERCREREARLLATLGQLRPVAMSWGAWSPGVPGPQRR